MNQQKLVKVLAIDGGGIRGVIPATFSLYLENITGRIVPLWQQFDVIVGTSTGGIMTLLLTRPDPNAPGQAMYSAQDVVNLYVQRGKDLFHSPRAYAAGNAKEALPEFPASSVVDTLQEFLPKPGCELRQALTNVAVTTYDISRRQPYLFESANAAVDPELNYYMKDVAQATSAFPGLFGAAQVTSIGGKTTRNFIDGGMSGASPIMQAYSYAVQLYGQKLAARSPQEFATHMVDGRFVDRELQVVLVSLGTGHYMAPIAYDFQTGWGLQQWAPLLPDIMFDSTARSAEREAAAFLGWDSYFRFQVDLPESLSGTADVDDVKTLQEIAEQAAQGPLRSVFDQLRARLSETSEAAAGTKG